MPIFEYECPNCGVFDVLQLPGEKALKLCPTCQKKKKKVPVKKVVSSPSFHLKGSGWYKTDYASPAKEKSSKSKGEASDTGSDKTSDSASDKVAPETKKTEKSESKSKSEKKSADTSA